MAHKLNGHFFPPPSKNNHIFHQKFNTHSTHDKPMYIVIFPSWAVKQLFNHTSHLWPIGRRNIYEYHNSNNNKNNNNNDNTLTIMCIITNSCYNYHHLHHQFVVKKPKTGNTRLFNMTKLYPFLEWNRKSGKCPLRGFCDHMTSHENSPGAALKWHVNL